MAEMAPAEGSVSLVAGRSKRSTAGNRMRALLDQQHNLSTTNEADEIFREEENDAEFAAPQREEEDVFDSDFGDSSDEEEGQEGRRKGGDDDDEGERELEAEEERKRKAARKASRMAPSVVRRPAKPKPPPSALPSRARDAEVQAEAGPSRPSRTSRRISFAPDAGQGDTSVDPNSSSRRISSRRATVQAGLDSQVRIEEAEARRLQHPNVRNPPSAVKKPSLNQAELIELALEREEENRKSLKEWMEVEEERKRKELGREKRALPSSWIRWRSVRSEVPIERPIVVLETSEQPAREDEKDALLADASVVEVPPKPEPTAEAKAEADVSGTVVSTAEPQADDSVQIVEESDQTANDSIQVVADETRADESGPVQPDESGPVLPPSASRSTSPQALSSKVDFTLDPVLQARKEAAAAAAAAAQKSAEASSSKTQGADAPPTELEARSLVSLHYTTRPAPPWPEQWASLLGSHTNWATTHVVPARNRPSKPRASLCAITGKMARYRDAKTGIPFADVKAARVLRALGEEQWEWCEVDIDAAKRSKTDQKDGDVTPSGGAGPAAEEGVVKKVKKSAKKVTDGSAGGDGQGKTGFWMLAQVRPAGGAATETNRKTTQATAEASSVATSTPGSASALQSKPSLKRKVSAMATPGASRAASSKKKTAGRPSSSSHASPAASVGGAPSPAAAPASTSTATPQVGSVAATRPPAIEEAPPHLAALGVAPGDEQAVLARALALPSGTTRSGKARSSLPANAPAPAPGAGAGAGAGGGGAAGKGKGKK